MSSIFASPKLSRLLTAVLTLCAVTLLPLQQSLAQTVTEIVNRGKIRIGVTIGAPPFGSIDTQGNPVGYDTDVANLLAKYINLPAELVPLTPASRIAALEAGKVDLLVATLSATPERAKQYMFTMPYNIFRVGIYAAKGSSISGWDDLKKMRVGINRDSSVMGELAKREGPDGLQIVRFEGNAIGIQALLSKQIDAWVEADSIANQALKVQPDADMEAKFFFINQPNSMTVKKDAFELHQWLNNFIYFIKNTGELDAISEKWIGAPLPKNFPVF